MLINKAQQICDAYISGSLDLRGCDLKGVTLPATIGGWLDLTGCDLKDVTLPATVGGRLFLRGCDLKGVTLPATIGGWLDLTGFDLKDVTLPATIGGRLFLRGCDLKDVTLPATIGGFAMPTEADQHANLCAIAPLALAAGALDMSDVHACETTHCLAGWACHSLPNGMAMEEKLGWEMAGLMLLGPDAFAVFLESDDVARKFLEAVEATS